MWVRFTDGEVNREANIEEVEHAQLESRNKFRYRNKEEMKRCKRASPKIADG
jgi:hypothetical protein